MLTNYDNAMHLDPMFRLDLGTLKSQFCAKGSHPYDCDSSVIGYEVNLQVITAEVGEKIVLHARKYSGGEGFSLGAM